MAKKNNMTWSFYHVWNKSIETRKKREPQARNRIWASEIGGAYVDRYLKMTGVEPTNPPDARALRKFEAGNMMEWIVDMVLKRAGILIDNQKWIAYKYPGLFEVTGKLDQEAGGNPDWDKAKEEIEHLGLPPFFGKATKAIVKHLSKKYPDGLKKIILETKSCSSYMFEKYKKGADIRHKLQAFHYLMATGRDEAHIVYISKDDLRMIECGVFRTPDLEKLYKDDIEAMTKYVETKTQPELEKEIIYDPEFGKFSANWKIGYSNYLEMLYGYKSQGDFDDKHKPMVARFNRVLTRMRNKKNMTDDNKAAIEEMKKWEPNIEEIIKEEQHGKA
jgi:hypothetical protein